ncbi:MAG: hypothetical protein K5924_11755 [Chloroflexi bacterium]|nr:hypothetical protein [Chloroflexota bacterium]
MPRVVTVVLVAVGLVSALAGGAPDPAAELASRDIIGQRAAEALEAVDRLAAAVDPALEAGRVAAAGLLTGEGSPSAPIEEAARLAAAAEERVLDARRAVARLTSALDAARPDAVVPQPVAAGELASIGAQLDAAIDAAETFVGLRRRATGLPGRLDDALARLDSGAVAGAREQVAAARDDHSAVVAWETDLATLPVWIETTDAMISAVEQIVEAVEADDAAAAKESAAAFAALGADGARADRALRIALGEGGSAVLAAPLERLAAVMGGIEATRAALRDLVGAGR